MHDTFTENVDQANQSVDKAEAAASRAGMQNEHATHDYVLEAFQTDPRISDALGKHFVEKSSLAPADVFQDWVTDGGEALTQLQQYLALPEGEKENFWNGEASEALRSKLDKTKSVINAGVAVESPEDSASEAQEQAEACWELLGVECDPAVVPKAIEFLAGLAAQVDLMEQDLDGLGQVVQMQVEGWTNDLLIEEKNDVIEEKDDVIEEKNDVIEKENEIQLSKRKEAEALLNNPSLSLADINKALDNAAAWKIFIADDLAAGIDPKDKTQGFAALRVKLEDAQARAQSVLAAYPADKDPAANAELQNIFASQPLNWREANPEAQFAGVLEAVNSSDTFSAEQKNDIAVRLGVPPETVKTGTDIQNTLTAGYIDPQTGERKPFTKENPSKLNEGTVIYEKNDGTRVVEVTLPDGREIAGRFSAEIGGAKVGQIAYTIQMMYATERLNLAEPIFQRGWNITQGGEIDLHYDDIIRAQKIGDSLVGGGSGRDGLILDNARIDGLRHRFQAFNSKGDETTYVNDPEAATRDLQELGIVDDGGKLVWTEFDKAAGYLQKVEATGGKPDFQLLKNFLKGEKPEESGNSQSA